jgi:hypothetical protein
MCHPRWRNVFIITPMEITHQEPTGAHMQDTNVKIMNKPAFLASKDLFLQNLSTNNNLWVLSCASYNFKIFCCQTLHGSRPWKRWTGLSYMNKLKMTWLQTLAMPLLSFKSSSLRAYLTTFIVLRSMLFKCTLHSVRNYTCMAVLQAAILLFWTNNRATCMCCWSPWNCVACISVLSQNVS